MVENVDRSWRNHSRAVRLLFVVVFVLWFLYAGVTANPLLMRATNFMAAIALFILGRQVLHRSDLGITLGTAAAGCLFLSGVLFGYVSIVEPLEGLLVFGDGEALLTDIATLLLFAGGGLSYLSSR